MNKLSELKKKKEQERILIKSVLKQTHAKNTHFLHLIITRFRGSLKNSVKFTF